VVGVKPPRAVSRSKITLSRSTRLFTVPSLAPWHCWLEDRRIYDPRTFQSYMVAQSPKLGSKLGSFKRRISSIPRYPSQVRVSLGFLTPKEREPLPVHPPSLHVHPPPPLENLIFPLRTTQLHTKFSRQFKGPHMILSNLFIMNCNVQTVNFTSF